MHLSPVQGNMRWEWQWYILEFFSMVTLSSSGVGWGCYGTVLPPGAQRTHSGLQSLLHCASKDYWKESREGAGCEVCLVSNPSGWDPLLLWLQSISLGISGPFSFDLASWHCHGIHCVSGTSWTVHCCSLLVTFYGPWVGRADVATERLVWNRKDRL